MNYMSHDQLPWMASGGNLLTTPEIKKILVVLVNIARIKFHIKLYIIKNKHALYNQTIIVVCRVNGHLHWILAVNWKRYIMSTNSVKSYGLLELLRILSRPCDASWRHIFFIKKVHISLQNTKQISATQTLYLFDMQLKVIVNTLTYGHKLKMS